MMFAHVPAGYLLARLVRRLAPPAANQRALLAWGMVGGIAPDIDLFWANYVDHWMVHHHRYVTHWPSFWLLALGLAALVLAWRRVGSGGWLALGVFTLGVGSHLCLDWVVSAMWLLAPFSDESFQFVHVPFNYRHWLIRLLTQWTTWADIGIAALGGLLAWRDAREWWQARRGMGRVEAAV